MKKFCALSIVRITVILFSIGTTWAQTQIAGPAHSVELSGRTDPTLLPTETANGKESAPSIASSEAVVTIRGLCGNKSVPPTTATNSCATVVTREAFERLLDSMNILSKPLTPETRRSLAEVYAEYLALEGPATKEDLENTPRFAEIMNWWRLRTLAALYRGALLDRFKNPSADEIHAYYLAHLTSFQRVKASRILVPRSLGDTDAAKLADQKALDLANSARDRAAKGEDPEVVQKSVYAFLGISFLPATDLGTHSRSSFPTDETDELFALPPGQVSKVETEGASYVIYKIAANETQSEEAVKDEIAKQIAQNKYDEAMRSINDSAKPEFNQAYFGPPRPVTSPNPLASSHP
jgi:hypothetical protein